MAKSLEPAMNKIGGKMILTGGNADETSVNAIAEMQYPSQIKTFSERSDIKAIREAGGAVVASTTVISLISKYSFF